MRRCRSRTLTVFGELLSSLLRIGRSAVRPRPWPPAPKSTNSVLRRSSSELCSTGCAIPRFRLPGMTRRKQAPKDLIGHCCIKRSAYWSWAICWRRAPVAGAAPARRARRGHCGRALCDHHQVHADTRVVWRWRARNADRGSPERPGPPPANVGSAQADGDAGMLGGIQPTQQIHLRGSRHLHAALRGRPGVDVDEER